MAPRSDASSPHPSVAGREVELARLVAGVRRLVDRTNTTVAPGPTLHRIAAELEPVVTDLEGLVPDPVPARLALGGDAMPPGRRNPFDVVTGTYNPVAPPVRIRHEAGEAIGEVTFGRPYEGPPGRVHGAVLVGVFDMVFSGANTAAGLMGPTASLRIHYEAATRVEVPAEFRARQTGVEGRRLHVEGELRQHGEVTCRATGLFIRLDPDELAAMADG